MSWGIAETASEKEKIKSEFTDFIHGLNSCGDINAKTYNELWDYTIPLFDKMYEQGKKDAQVKND